MITPKPQNINKNNELQIYRSFLTKKLLLTVIFTDRKFRRSVTKVTQKQGVIIAPPLFNAFLSK